MNPVNNSWWENIANWSIAMVHAAKEPFRGYDASYILNFLSRKHEEQPQKTYLLSVEYSSPKTEVFLQDWQSKIWITYRTGSFIELLFFGIHY